ncbi:SprT family protein [Staphylococcus canis]|uniref:Protein SprT-like n=1 Tax=Staphylococcus canis TaxID=2724942 RepID=A0ABS0T9R6_9STAP|nr:SprT family protein [Staphylococcus canis]MBI5975481.1 SprT family protein [Staphylococcus canis]
MNDNELQYLVEYIALRYFDDTFEHRAYFNKRLRTTGGRYMLESHHIEINPKQYELFGEEAVRDIIKHELCHYFLHLQGKGYQHKDTDFKKLCQKVGAPRFCQPTMTYNERVNHHYRCRNCGQDYYRIRRVNLVKMRCGQCGSKLKEL